MQPGGGNPLPQTLTIAGTGGSIEFTPSNPVTTSGGNWLAWSGCSAGCFTPSLYSVSVSGAGLPAGTYAGQIVVTANDHTSSITVLVTLTVVGAGMPSLGGLPGALSFAAGSGMTPAPQTIQIANTGGGTLAWTAAVTMFNGPTVGNSNWLTFAASGGTAPAILTVSVNATGLAGGLYLGQVLVQTPSGGSTTIPVTLEVAGGANNVVFDQPPQLSFTMQVGGANPLPQTLTIAGTGGSIEFTPANPMTTSGGSWLAWSGCSAGCFTPSLYSISVSGAGLPAGTYTGQIVVTANDHTSSITVLVTLTVVGAGMPSLGGLPGALSFAAGSGMTPAPQTIQIANTGGGTLAWTAAVTMFNGPTVGNSNWLTFAASGGTAPAILTVSVNATGLAGGLYLGQVLVQTPSGGSTTIPVTLEVAGGANNVVFDQPPQLSFTMQVGGANPLPQTLTIAGTGGSIEFTPANPVTTSGGSWLAWSGCSAGCFTPSLYSVSVSGAGLPAGTYTGQIVVTANDHTSSITVLVTLTVVGAGMPSLGGLPGALSFAAGSGMTPAPQTIQIANTGGGTLAWTAAVTMFNGPTVGNSNWLTFAASGGTAPAILTVSVNATGLAGGLYLGQVLVQTPSGGSTTIPVTLEVAGGANNVVFDQPPQLSFTMQVGGANPLPQTLTIAGTGGSIEFTPANPVTTSGGSWLAWSGCSAGCFTPSLYSISVSGAGLPAGTYTGQIVVTANDHTSSITVLVTLTVVGADMPSLGGLPGALSFAAGSGMTPAPQTIQIANTGGGTLAWTAAVTMFNGPTVGNSNWLTFAASGGTAPAILTVSVNATGLAGGLYLGQVLVQTPSGGSTTIPVTLEVAGGANNVVFDQPPQLSFTMQVGGANPLPQTLTIAGTGGSIEFTPANPVTTSGGSWLAWSGCSAGCFTPSLYSVSVSGAGLPAGTYTGQIVVAANDRTRSITVLVTLTVAGTGAITVSPGSLSFTGSGSQTLSISNTSTGALFTATASASSGGNWLSLLPSQGTTPAQITVTVDSTAMQPGNYTGAVTITSASATNSPLIIPVSVVLSSQPGPTLSSISPSSGAAGNTVSISFGGSGFVSGATVQVANPGITVSNVSVVSASQITATFSIAANATGQANVTIITPAGKSSPVGFTITPAGIDNMLVASPASLSFNYQTGATAPPPQSLTVSSTNGSLLPFTVAAATSDGAEWLIPGVNAGTSPEPFNVIVSPVGLTNGIYSGRLTISSANVPSVVVSVILTVTSPTPPQLSVQATPLNLSGVQGGSAAVGQIEVSNPGGGILTFTASAQGGTWLTVSPITGIVDNSTVGAGNAPPVELAVTCDPSALKDPGIYQGSIVVTGAASTVTVPVTFSVAASAQSILLSQSALTFTAVAQGGSPLPKQLGILNTGNGTLNWSAAVTTLSGGNWLNILPGNGTVQRPYLDVSLASIAIDPSVLASLPAGDYYGQIQITATAVNSPQLVTVYLSIMPPGSNPGPEISPSSLIFTGASGKSPGPQQVSVGITRATADEFVSGNIGKGFSYSPSNSQVLPSQPVTVNVSPDFTSLLPGEIDRGTITLQFSDGTPRTISVLTVVAPSSQANSRSTPGVSAVASCANLNVQWRTPSSQGFTAVQGQGSALNVQIVDDCGNLIGPGNPTAATVLATFSDGDANVRLVHIGNGIWAGTWTPLNPPNGLVAVNVTASNTAGALLQTGQATELTATVMPGTSPAVASGGVLQAASLVPGAPIAPGSIVSIFGSNLADTSSGSPTQVMLGNLPLPLFYIGSGQLNAQVPYDVPLNTQYQLQVQRGNALSAPQQLVIADAQPGIFTLNQTGTGPGVILLSDGVTLAQGNTPAGVGETIVIYCTGLGLVYPQVPAGVPPPATTLSKTVNAVSVTIAGIDAPDVSYSGLTPGFPGLYQVNVVVPAGADVGDSNDDVPVTLTVDGHASPAVTIKRPHPAAGRPGDRPGGLLKE